MTFHGRQLQRPDARRANRVHLGELGKLLHGQGVYAVQPGGGPAADDGVGRHHFGNRGSPERDRVGHLAIDVHPTEQRPGKTRPYEATQDLLGKTAVSCFGERERRTADKQVGRTAGIRNRHPGSMLNPTVLCVPSSTGLPHLPRDRSQPARFTIPQSADSDRSWEYEGRVGTDRGSTKGSFGPIADREKSKGGSGPIAGVRGAGWDRSWGGAGVRRRRGRGVLGLRR